MPPLDSFVGKISRARATLDGDLRLVAMRRWQLVERESTRSLLAAVKSAGLNSVLIDPCDGKPLKLVTSGASRSLTRSAETAKMTAAERNRSTSRSSETCRFRSNAMTFLHGGQ